jgi:hypothetical protein
MLWYKMFDDILVRLMGFLRYPVAPCLYIRRNENSVIISTIFVDDGTLCCTSEDLIDSLMTEIHKHLPKVTVVKHIQKYIGIKTDYNQNSRHIELSHPVYIDEKFKDDSSSVETIPKCPSYNLRKELPNPANTSYYISRESCVFYVIVLYGIYYVLLVKYLLVAIKTLLTHMYVLHIKS